MPIISQTVESRYWVVTDSDSREDGKFDINLKEVADYQGSPVAVKPATRLSITRNQDVARGTIVKVDTTTTVDRTFTPNPTS